MDNQAKTKNPIRVLCTIKILTHICGSVQLSTFSLGNYQALQFGSIGLCKLYLHTCGLVLCVGCLNYIHKCDIFDISLLGSRWGLLFLQTYMDMFSLFSSPFRYFIKMCSYYLEVSPS